MFHLAIFKAQVTGSIFSQDIFYILASIMLFLVVICFGLIDSGLVRRKNLLDTWIQKLVASLLSGLAFLIIGYAIWNWQFNEAFGIKNPLGEAIKMWWIGGSSLLHFSQNISPEVSPNADVYQVFMVFFFAYAAAMGALIHSIGLERVKAVPVYILSVVAGGIMMPFMTYLTWGSTSPLTNEGLHDYVGNFSFYIFIGVWALILAWRVGPRLGVRTPHPRTIGPFPHNMGTTAFGVGLLMFAIPLLVLGCGYWANGFGYYGIALTESGIGLVLINVFCAFAAGGVGGAIIAYWRRNSVMALLGPISGYISGTAGFDVFKPWQMLVIALVAPFVVYAGYLLMERLKIDEQKVVPLALFGGIYSAIVTGFVAWHTHDGGFFELTGAYAPGHAQISPQWQLIGVGVTVGAAAISGLVLIVGLEKTIGLRVSEEQELGGLDLTYWDLPSADEMPYEPAVPVSVGNGVPAVDGGGVPTVLDT